MPKPQSFSRTDIVEKNRIKLLPAYMRSCKSYPEEFTKDIIGHPEDASYWIKVIKGQDPRTKERYMYGVRIDLEENVEPNKSRFFPVAIYRMSDKPQKWVNKTGSGFVKSTTGGLNLVWRYKDSARSERTNSIIAKAKTILHQLIRTETPLEDYGFNLVTKNLKD